MVLRRPESADGCQRTIEKVVIRMFLAPHELGQVRLQVVTRSPAVFFVSPLGRAPETLYLLRMGTSHRVNEIVPVVDFQVLESFPMELRGDIGAPGIRDYSRSWRDVLLDFPHKCFECPIGHLDQETLVRFAAHTSKEPLLRQNSPRVTFAFGEQAFVNLDVFAVTTDFPAIALDHTPCANLTHVVVVVDGGRFRHAEVLGTPLDGS